MEFLDLFKTSFIIVIAIIVFTVQVIVFNDPPSFPLPENAENSIDCFNIVSSTIRIDKSRIRVSMNIKDFIQYPIEVASSMVHIESSSGDVNFSFSSDVFWDLVSDRHHISFVVLQTAAGDVQASLYCQKNQLAKTKNKIQSLDAYPVGWSRLYEDQYFSSTFTDVCINPKTKLVFCSRQSAQIGNFHASWTEEIPITVTSQSAANYQSSERIPILEDFTIYVPYNSALKKTSLPKPEDFLIDTILPLIGSLSFTPNSYLVPNNKILEQLTPIVGSKARVVSRRCFKNISYLPSTGSYNVISQKKYQNFAQAQAIHIKFLLSLSKESIQKIKKFYSYDESPYDIVLDQTSSQFANTLRDLSENIFVINDKHNFTYVAKVLSSAKVFVSSNVKTLFFGSLMKKDSTLIEVIPDGMNCLKFKDHLSSKFDVNYKVLENNEKNCICKDIKNLDCYFKYENKYNRVDSQELYDLVKSSLK